MLSTVKIEIFIFVTAYDLIPSSEVAHPMLLCNFNSLKLYFIIILKFKFAFLARCTYFYTFIQNRCCVFYVILSEWSTSMLQCRSSFIQPCFNFPFIVFMNARNANMKHGKSIYNTIILLVKVHKTQKYVCCKRHMTSFQAPFREKDGTKKLT